MKLVDACATLAVLLIGGCAEEPGAPGGFADARSSIPASAPGGLSPVTVSERGSIQSKRGRGAGQRGEPDAPDVLSVPTTPDDTQSAAASRKIIYNAELQLVVEDLTVVETGVTRLVKERKGYISEQEIVGSMGSQRHGRWKVRVPIAHFDAFVADVAKLGIPEKNQLTSEDVTDRFYDTQARIQNKKVEEARLLKLLEERTGKLEDVLKVEAELSRVRGEVEQLQGALNLLANLTALTTVTILAQERKDYVPPAAPTFTGKVGRTFHDSLDKLVKFGEALVLFAVGLAPWLPVLAVVAAVGWLVVRRRRRRLQIPSG
jgi:hypothetical protein